MILAVSSFFFSFRTRTSSAYRDFLFDDQGTDGGIKMVVFGGSVSEEVARRADENVLDSRLYAVESQLREVAASTGRQSRQRVYHCRSIRRLKDRTVFWTINTASTEFTTVIQRDST